MDYNTHSKEELLENISELFLRFGLRSTSMDDIANHLKISKKTLYQQFANKDDVVEQVMLYRRESRNRYTDVEHFQNMNPIEVMYQIEKYIINDLSSRLPANYFDMKKYHPAVYQKITEKDDDFTKNFFVSLLKEGIKQHYFKEETDSKLQIYLLGKQLRFLQEPETISQIEYPIPIIISTIIRNFLIAISTEKGIAEIERINQNANHIEKK